MSNRDRHTFLPVSTCVCWREGGGGGNLFSREGGGRVRQSNLKMFAGWRGGSSEWTWHSLALGDFCLTLSRRTHRSGSRTKWEGHHRTDRCHLMYRGLTASQWCCRQLSPQQRHLWNKAGFLSALLWCYTTDSVKSRLKSLYSVRCMLNLRCNAMIASQSCITM